MFKITEFQADFQNIQLSNAVSFYVILDPSKLFWLGFGSDQKQLFTTEFCLLNEVQKVLIGPKQFGRVQERYSRTLGFRSIII